MVSAETGQGELAIEKQMEDIQPSALKNQFRETCI